MHELSLAYGVVKAIEGEADRQAFERVERIVLEIGALSHVDPEALRTGLDAATSGSLASGAAIEINVTLGSARCFACESDVTIARRGDACPECGSHQLVVTSGDEMKLKALEVV